MGLALYSVAAVAVATQFLPKADAYIPAGPFFDPQDCVKLPCETIDETSLYPRVAQAWEEFSKHNTSIWKYLWHGVQKNPEYLRFSPAEDNREKSLTISAGYDHNGALDPTHLSALVNELGKEFDTKFVVAYTVDDVCRHIKEAAELAETTKTGNLTSIFLSAHGNPINIAISAPGIDSGTLNEKTDFANCFKGLDPSGRIVLLSGLSGSPEGGDPKNNIAQKMATLAKREVIAATEMVYPKKMGISSYDQLRIFHPSAHKSSVNIFKLFRPVYQRCEKVFENLLHQREKEALDAISKNWVQKGLKSSAAGFEETQEYVRFCGDDPKKKVLFLTAHADHNGGLNPAFIAEVLGALADHYDIKFKVVSKYDQVCEEIKAAAETGNLENVIIHSHGTATGMQLSDNNIDIENWIAINSQNISKCFSGINPEGRIVLMSCRVGQPQQANARDNIAKKIADLSRRTVIAPDELHYSSEAKITKKEPLELYHKNQQGMIECLFVKPHNIYKKF